MDENKEKVIEKLKKWIAEKGIITIDTDVQIECLDERVQELRDGENRKVYEVWFRTADSIRYDDKGEIDAFVEGSYCTAYFDAASLNLLYIAKGTHGYIEPDGSF